MKEIDVKEMFVMTGEFMLKTLQVFPVCLLLL